MAYTFQEIINRAKNSYLRNTPLVQQSLVDILQGTYEILLDEQEWNEQRSEFKIVSPAVEGQEFALPDDFIRIDQETPLIVDNDYTIDIDILERGDIEFYSDFENRTVQTSYFSVIRRGGKSFLVFNYGRAPQTSISFTYLAGAENVAENLEHEPQRVHPKFHNILIYGLARDSLIARNIDNTEAISLSQLERKYGQRLSQYARFNNEILLVDDEALSRD